MNQAEFDKIVAETKANIDNLLRVKGGEYAGSEDRLANFKRGAALTGCTPLQVLFIYLSKHYDAVASFVKSSAEGQVRESSEPIEGRLDDLINYCILAKGLVAENSRTALRDDGVVVELRGPGTLIIGLDAEEAENFRSFRNDPANSGVIARWKELHITGWRNVNEFAWRPL